MNSIAKVANLNNHNNSNKNNPFIIVGIGASAGGLSAFESFFQAIPSDCNSGMAFLLIQHLSPDYKSILQELVQQYTTMKVYEAQDGIRVEPNCVYVIPPNYNMGLLDGTIELTKPLSPRGHRLPIDYFFNSLAVDQHRYAVGIILSGTAHDGSIGIKAIKKAGGLVLVQSIESSEFAGMPESAIATHYVDYVLNPNEMFKKLVLHAKNISNYKSQKIYSDNDENILQKIFILLRNKTTHDFSMYKPSTVGRRIARRMAVHQIENTEEYYNYLRQNENEIDELFNDLLIGVTNFFRDKEAFDVLENTVIPSLFVDKLQETAIRVWIAGCSTGEEAYSIAILIVEYMEKIKQNFTIQIFATDIDGRAINTARAGIYPLTIEENISQQRLEQYFVKNNNKNTYRIHKNIRDLLIFSIHDVIKDPPFSQLDLISCRNLLIYMNAQLQKKLILSFHYALKSDGVLFLGTSETVGEFNELFHQIEQKSKLYQCKKDTKNTRKMIQNRLLLMENIMPYHQLAPKIDLKTKLSLCELTEKTILKQIAPASVLINENGDILYLHGRTGMYLELPSGETNTNNVLKMAREGLQQDLTLALHKAKTTKEIVHIKDIHINSHSQILSVYLSICPVDVALSLKEQPALYVVIFQDELEAIEAISAHYETSDDENNNPDENQKIKALKQELQLQKEFLQDMNEKLEISNEELKSYNEEIQSMNEELQSSNEELETSKEELQSVNEELSTVNSELSTKVIDLSRINNDMNNLLAGTGIGTIFVDFKLCILRFTPAVTNIINLIVGDLGRPVAHIVSNLIDYDTLVIDTQNVLDTLIPKEIEVKTIDGKWFLMRIQPYRTIENVIEGAVISFVNITDIVDMRTELQNAYALSRLAVIVRDSNDAITVQDMSGKITAWNNGATKMYGWSEDEALKMHAKDRIPKELQQEDEKRLIQLSQDEILESYKTKRLTKNGNIINVSVTSTALINSTNGKSYAISTTERQFYENKNLNTK